MANSSSTDLCTSVSSSLMDMLSTYGFERAAFHPPDSTSMGGWYFEMESTEFIITAGQDRDGDVLGICLGSKIRRNPRAHMRGPWSLGHLRGFIESLRVHYSFQSATEQLEWLAVNLDSLINTALLNSDELNEWAVKASRRMFGRDSNSSEKK